MSNNFSRECLRPLVDRTVHLYGRLIEKKRQPDGSIHALLTAVKVRPYNSEVPALSVDPIRVSHLWVTIKDPSLIPESQLLGQVAGLGKVHYYSRGDGSVDLGVRLFPSIEYTGALLELKKYLNEINIATQILEFRDLLEKAQRDLKESTGWVKSSKATMKDVVRDLSRHVEALERDQSASLRAYFGEITACGMSRRERRERDRRLKKRRHQEPSGPLEPTHVPTTIHLHP